MGKDEKRLIEMARKQNMPLLARIKNFPELQPGLSFYLDAFYRLTTSRSMSQGAIGAIPYSAISTYCKDEAIGGDMRQDLFYHVEKMDAAYISWQNDRAAYEAKATETAAKKSGS